MLRPRDVMTMTASPLFAALAMGCVAPKPPWMAPQAPRASASASDLVEVARAAPPPGHRALLVAHPRTACSGSAATVFMDATGRFLGAVGPGEASLLVLPERLRTVMVLSSVEITAPVGTRFSFVEVEVPAAPEGILLESTRVNARQCGRNGQYASPSIASKAEIEARLAGADVLWLEPRVREGQAWLDAHRPRVDELIPRGPAAPPRIVVHRGEPTAR